MQGPSKKEGCTVPSMKISIKCTKYNHTWLSDSEKLKKENKFQPGEPSNVV